MTNDETKMYNEVIARVPKAGQLEEKAVYLDLAEEKRGGYLMVH